MSASRRASGVSRQNSRRRASTSSTPPSCLLSSDCSAPRKTSCQRRPSVVTRITLRVVTSVACGSSAVRIAHAGEYQQQKDAQSAEGSHGSVPNPIQGNPHSRRITCHRVVQMIDRVARPAPIVNEGRFYLNRSATVWPSGEESVKPDSPRAEGTTYPRGSIGLIFPPKRRVIDDFRQPSSAGWYRAFA